VNNLPGLHTYHNAENGFCVLRVKARGQRDLVTVVGAAAAISAGEFIQASGIWINDRTHGLQFKAAFFKSAPPTRWRASSAISAPAWSRASDPSTPAG